MGQGNFKPSADYARMRYYDHEMIMEWYGCECADDYEWAFNEFCETIRSGLPDSFEHGPPTDNPIRDAWCVAHNGLAALYVKDTGPYIAVFAVPLQTCNQPSWDEDPSPLAIHYLFNRLPLYKVWQALGMKAYVRYSAWTSDYVTAEDHTTENRFDPR